MKKLFTRAFTMLGALMMLSSTASAQDMPLPVDKDVRIGQLPNGMTYYIRHNETPKGQADFYIAQKVGSALEEDNQRGLAHFLEHMCFNGTVNFPGNEVINWLETVGVKFGQNLNAYTSIDETVYNISNVPIARESVQDSCLLILHDWADGLLLDPKEIDKERGVIHQEWRRSMVGQMRILENILPIMYPNNKYGYRLPIGTMEVVDNFPPQALRDYYEAWYRPDQQGIIVVGDIDVDRIENKIKEIFSPIEMPANAPERTYIPVEDTEGTIYAIGHDKEQKYGIVQMMFKTDPFPNEMKGNLSYMVQDYIIDMIVSMLNNRLSDMMSNPETPFAQAGAQYGEYMVAKTKDAFTIVGIAKDNDVRPALESVYRELLRALRGGFTVSEYDRARSEYLSRLEKAYNNRNNRESEGYVKEYVRHFIDNEPIPGIETEYQMMNMVANQIPVEALNTVLPQLITDNNRVVVVMTPENDQFVIPTEAQLAEVIKKVDGETIEAFIDEVKSEPLIPALPAPGKIVKESTNSQWGTTEWILSNGAKVIIKPTTFKEDEILFDAQALGGTSVIGNDKANSLIFMDVAMSQTGLGTYTNKDMSKYLAGKQAHVSVDLGDYNRDIRGSSTVKDLPTLMELIYMTFTDLTIDPAEFEALQKMYSGILQNQESDPQYIFQRDLNKALYSNPRREVISSEHISKASREEILEIAHAMTANAADYTFIFVGNIDLNTFRPLVEQYIATIKGNAKTATKKIKYDPTLSFKSGKGTDTFTTKMETPQTYVAILASAEIPYTSKDQKLASIAGQILSKRLLDTVREDMGAVYSIGAGGSLGRISKPNAIMQSVFPMKPEMKAEVLDFIEKEFAAMQSNVTNEELSKVIEFMVKEAIEGKEKNPDWLNAIGGFEMNGVDTFNGNVETLNAITAEDVQNFMKALLKSGNYRVVVLDPAE